MSAITVSGPISGGKHGWPFAAAIRDVAAEGYVEEEFFFSGTADRYQPVGELGTDGHWTVERAGTTPFVTRGLVRRPLDPARFNGTVIVEWNNVSAGLEIFEAGDTSVIFDEGFAYIGVSAQRVGVHGHDVDPQGLRAWDPERYSSLDVPDDAISYGIFTEVARAVSANRSSSVDPLAGLKVQKVLGIGGSQSAGRLATYINAIQPIEHAFDGFVLFTWFGSGMSVDDPRTINLATAGLDGIITHPTKVRDDLDVPVLVVNTECETVRTYPVRQPDTDRFRLWEVAGAPHGPALHMERIFAKMMHDQASMPTPPPGDGPAEPPMLGPVPFAPVMDAGMAHMQRWMNGGDPPPQQPLIEVDAAGPTIKRDADGNALGGVRLPEMEATITRNIGSMEEAGMAGLMGVTTPLPADIVRARYPDMNTYLAKFRAAADRAVQAGVLRQRDADEALERAKRTRLPA